MRAGQDEIVDNDPLILYCQSPDLVDTARSSRAIRSASTDIAPSWRPASDHLSRDKRGRLGVHADRDQAAPPASPPGGRRHCLHVNSPFRGVVQNLAGFEADRPLPQVRMTAQRLSSQARDWRPRVVRIRSVAGLITTMRSSEPDSHPTTSSRSTRVRPAPAGPATGRVSHSPADKTGLISRKAPPPPLFDRLPGILPDSGRNDHVAEMLSTSAHSCRA